MKLILQSKDKRITLYIDKKTFMMSTFATRDLQNPPINSPCYFIEYSFGSQMYSLTQFTGNTPYLFTIDLQDTVRMITHFYQAKMTLLKMIIDSEIQNGHFQFMLPDEEVQGFVDLNIQKVYHFPPLKDINKQHVEYLNFFQLTEDMEKLKQIQNYNQQCWYQIHQNGVCLRGYRQDREQNMLTISKEYLKNYDPEILKKQLKMNIFVLQPNMLMLQQVKNCVKRNYKSLRIRFILIRHPNQLQSIKYSYLQIRSKLSSYPDSYKITITKCEVCQKANPQGIIVVQAQPVHDLLKNQDNQIETMRMMVINKWAEPNLMDMAMRREEKQRYKEGRDAIVKDDGDETNTRKLFFKFQDD